jgi:hypothetical protein
LPPLRESRRFSPRSANDFILSPRSIYFVVAAYKNTEIELQNTKKADLVGRSAWLKFYVVRIT